MEYHSNIGTQIERQQYLRDLGVAISQDATFSQYISEKICKMQSKINRVLRTFQARDKVPIFTLWKSIILSEHDYYCQLWNPKRSGEIQSLEHQQHFFTKKIYGLSHLSYWDKISYLKAYSLERRREWYIAIYVWKILEGLVQNISTDEGAITVTWRIFNSFPQYMRDTTKSDTNLFNAQLDKYLEQASDQPLIPGYTTYRQCESNSLIDCSRNAKLNSEVGVFTASIWCCCGRGSSPQWPKTVGPKQIPSIPSK